MQLDNFCVYFHFRVQSNKCEYFERDVFTPNAHGVWQPVLPCQEFILAEDADCLA